jgi:hypothetical protein
VGWNVERLIASLAFVPSANSSVFYSEVVQNRLAFGANDLIAFSEYFVTCNLSTF